MIPRLRIDAGLRDLAFGALACAGLAPAPGPGPGDARLTRRPDALVCLSVRSGFDLLLAVTGWPKGSEVLVSAITIPDLVRILREHGLVAVPVDLDPFTLEVDPAFLSRAVTPRTRAVVLTHLFGAQVAFDGAIAWARERGLMVIEDCAQAYAADGFAGSESSDVRMFSFGPIKTATALGGAVLLLRDRALLLQAAAAHRAWPIQRTSAYLARVLKFLLLFPLGFPLPYGALVRGLRALGRDPDAVVSRLGRGFAGGDFFARIRRRPCAALVRVLDRRLATYDAARVERRARAGALLLSRLSDPGQPGAGARRRTHWLFPVNHPQPDDLVRRCRAAGFDVARASSSLYAVEAGAGREEARRAAAAMRGVVYVPAHSGVSPRRLEALARMLNGGVG